MPPITTKVVSPRSNRNAGCSVELGSEASTQGWHGVWDRCLGSAGLDGEVGCKNERGTQREEQQTTDTGARADVFES